MSESALLIGPSQFPSLRQCRHLCRNHFFQLAFCPLCSGYSMKISSPSPYSTVYRISWVDLVHFRRNYPATPRGGTTHRRLGMCSARIETFQNLAIAHLGGFSSLPRGSYPATPRGGTIHRRPDHHGRPAVSSSPKKSEFRKIKISIYIFSASIYSNYFNLRPTI